MQFFKNNGPTRVSRRILLRASASHRQNGTRPFLLTTVFAEANPVLLGKIPGKPRKNQSTIRQTRSENVRRAARRDGPRVQTRFAERWNSDAARRFLFFPEHDALPHANKNGGRTIC